MLTASSMWMEGRYYSFLNTLHALTVILGLLYLNAAEHKRQPIWCGAPLEGMVF